MEIYFQMENFIVMFLVDLPSSLLIYPPMIFYAYYAN